MKVVALVRTLNEKDNIQRFCSRYSEFCDKIIVSDSGSVDNTVELAEQFPKVEIDMYTDLHDRVYIGYNWFYTKQPNHINHLFRLAKRDRFDWAIYSDCDLVPTYQLIKTARGYMETEGIDQINCRQYHMYGFHQYFPELTTGFAPWAFRLSKVSIHCDETDPRHMGGMVGRLDENDDRVKKPEGYELLMHFFAQDKKSIAKKIQHYARMQRSYKHPLERCGKLEEVPRELI